MNTNRHAGEMLEFSESGVRQSSGWQRGFIPLVAGSWSIFQLALPKFVLLNSLQVRAIHLSFALVLVFLAFPAIKKKKRVDWIKERLGSKFRWLHQVHGTPLIDLGLATAAAISALYLVFDEQAIGMRIGNLSGTDLFFGSVLVILLMEAARRSIGPALPFIATIFIVYSFFSEHMPDIVAFQNASLNKVVTKLSLSTEGIYGIPLDVSASTVFLFVLFGAMLERAGGGKYFIDLAFSLLGRFKGGPAKAAVLASGLTGMISGSSIANTVTTGTFTIPLMKRAGFSGVKAGGIEVAASTNGQLMPPIMGAAAFIIAEYCGLSYLEVVMAAIIPATASYVGLIYIAHLEASKLDLKPINKADLPRFWQTFWKGLYFLIPLGILLFQLLIARRSAQLAAFYGVAALMATMLSRQIYQGFRDKITLFSGFKLALAEIWDGLVAGGRNMMGIGVAVGAAGVIVGIVTLGLGNAITDVIDILAGGNFILLLFITAIICIILGMGLPTTANYIVMASLTAPAIVLLSGSMNMVVPLIAAHLFVFYFGILADDTPPVGLAAYAAAAISREDPIATGIQGFIYDMRTAILPFMFIFNTEILLINVKTIPHGLFVFASTVIAMFAFASITQNYLILRNKWYETLALFIACATLFLPQYFASKIGLSPIFIATLGALTYGFVIVTQKMRGPTPRLPA